MEFPVSTCTHHTLLSLCEITFFFLPFYMLLLFFILRYVKAKQMQKQNPAHQIEVLYEDIVMRARNNI